MELAGDLVNSLARVSQTGFLRFPEVRLGILFRRGCGHPRSRGLILGSRTSKALGGPEVKKPVSS